MNSNLLKKQDGQALLFVIVAATVALAIGINTSVRTITSLSRTTRSDSASRALAAAEGGIEQYLALSTLELEDAKDPSEACPVGNRDGSACVIDFDNPTGDPITSQARVTVTAFEPTYYAFELDSGQVKEVNLYDFNTGVYYANSQIEICWSGGPTGSEIMYFAYDNSGVRARGGLTGTDAPGLPYESGGFTSAGGGKDGFLNCGTVTIGNNIYGLRIRSVGGSSSVGVYPVGVADLPVQGYTIKSVGTIAQEGGVTATREISVIRTLPYLPVAFDYALYSRDAINKN